MTRNCRILVLNTIYVNSVSRVSTRETSVNIWNYLPSHVIHAESVNSLKLDVTNFGVIKTLFMIAEQNYTEQGTEVKYWHNLA